MVSSDEHAKGSESSGLSSSSDQVLGILVQSRDSDALEVLVLSELLVDDEGSEALDGVVEFVAPESGANLLHREVGPPRVLDTVLVAVVVDGCKSALQSLRVQEGVQGVTGRGEQVHRPWNHATVLLLRQVVVELSLGELLESVHLLVLSGDELLSKSSHVLFFGL